MHENKDFKKEFEEFARKIKEENNPIFKDDSLNFDDLDNMLNFKNDLKSGNGFKESNFDNFNDFKEIAIDDCDDLELKELFSDCDISDDFDGLFNEDLSKYLSIDLENEDIKMNLILKKDYSNFEIYERKKEFIKDLKDFIDEFESMDESDELMKFYNI